MTVNGGINGTVCNAQQYQQSLSTLDDPNPLITCLTSQQTFDLTLATGASFMSILAVFSVFVWIARNYLWYRKNVPRRDWRLFDRPFDIYMAALLVFDVWQAMGGLLNVRWANNGIVTTGPYCTAQGVIMQWAEVGEGLCILLLAVHTFISALWRVGTKARLWAVGMVSLVLCYVTLWVIIGPSTHKHYEVPTPYWCWINGNYAGDRLGGESVVLWVVLFVSILLYVPLYLWSKGRLSVDDNKWYKFHVHSPGENAITGYAQRRNAIRMLFYPLGYAFVLLPISSVRWSLWDHKQVPAAVVWLAAVIWNLSGFINVLLLVMVRPQLLLLTRPTLKVNVQSRVKIDTEQAFGTPKSVETTSDFSKSSEMPLRSLTSTVSVPPSILPPPPSLYYFQSQ